MQVWISSVMSFWRPMTNDHTREGRKRPQLVVLYLHFTAHVFILAGNDGSWTKVGHVGRHLQRKAWTPIGNRCCIYVVKCLETTTGLDGDINEKRDNWSAATADLSSDGLRRTKFSLRMLPPPPPPPPSPCPPPRNGYIPNPGAKYSKKSLEIDNSSGHTC